MFFVFVLCTSVFVSAMDCIPYNEDLTHQRCTETKNEVYNTTTPIINITFQESVQVINYTLYQVGNLGDPIPSDLFNLSNISSAITEINMVNLSSSLYQPTRYVSDGLYIFRINAFNVPNIQIEVAVLFKINGTGMYMWVSKPENIHVNFTEKPDFAFSNQSPFFLEIATERNVTECRFSQFGIPPNQSMENAYKSLPASFTTNTTNQKRVYIQNFSMDNYFGQYYDYNGYPEMIYIICNETATPSRYSYGEIRVGVDNSAPVISVTALPNPVVDGNWRNTTLTIQTDDASACTIFKVPPPQGSTPAINRSPTYNFQDFYDFLKSYSEQLLFDSSPTSAVYNFNITCDNLANLRSSKIYSVNVSLNFIQSFNFYSPASMINTTTLFVNGSTTIGDASCTATLNRSNPSSFFSLTKNQGVFYEGSRQGFSGTLPQVVLQGRNTVYVNCTYMSGGFSSKNFIVDTIPPSVPNITTNANSCSISRITAKAESADNVSGIDEYYYNMTLQDNPSNYTYERDGSSSNGQLYITINGDSIVGKVYNLNVWAVDKAGNVGQSSTVSITVSNSSIHECDFTPPIINIIASKDNLSSTSSNSWTIKVNCTDYGSGCQQSISYGLQTNASQTCQFSLVTGVMTPITISESSIFCAAVFDNNNNNKTDQKQFVVNYPLTCSNGIKDATETDVDCGGLCPKCDLNNSCIIDGNCISNYCKLGICSIPNCNDNIMNGQETGKDCGGPVCAQCGIGGKCIIDSDCVSLNCMNSNCVEANCTDSKKDGFETDIDCAGPCAKCINGKKCTAKIDCQSNYCDPATGICQIDPTLDTDGDGLPDVWEIKYFGNPTIANPNDDSDGDGYTNLEEFKAGTNPMDPNDQPTYHKLKYSSLIFLILGALMLIAGVVLKVMDVLEEENKKKVKEEKEMTSTLGQIPILTSLQPEKEAYTAEEIALRAQNRSKTLKMKSLERRKVLGQFDESEKINMQNSNLQFGATKIATTPIANVQSSKKYVDAGSKEEYLDLNEMNKKDKDAFDELKEMARKPSLQDIKKSSSQSQTTQKSRASQEQVSKANKKSDDEDEVFEKLKTMTKQIKKK